MTARLFEPLAPRTALMGAFVVVLGLAAYCLAYNWLQGRPETLANAIAWPVINLLPFFAAFEVGKRLPQWRWRLAAIGMAVAVSLFFGTLAGAGDLWFEAVRRLPTMFGIVTALAIADWLATADLIKPAAAIGPLPLDPRDIDHIRAAGNYVELHGRGRTILHRATISAVAVALQGNGFVRIHRSTLVRRDAVARWRPGYVEMRDGGIHSVGALYRAGLADTV